VVESWCKQTSEKDLSVLTSSMAAIRTRHVCRSSVRCCENVNAVADLVSIYDDKSQTHRTQWKISGNADP